jgi:hypothetical protein
MLTITGASVNTAILRKTLEPPARLPPAPKGVIVLLTGSGEVSWALT